MASDRDRNAARLHRQGWSYHRIAEQLGYRDRRAAHRGVLRGLAESAAEEAMLRAWQVKEIDEQLYEVQRRLWNLMERHQPYTGTTAADARAFFRILDALFAVLVRRCQLRGLFTHPYRYDTWWRRDVPFAVWAHLHLQANRLEREARIPVRWRALKRVPRAELVSVAPLRPGETPLVDLDSLVPASVRRLRDAAWQEAAVARRLAEPELATGARLRSSSEILWEYG
ncbi:MAG TPA: hypothetical protein VFO16_11230 [Pseudonocardiaceae bacterium]|nr:hypothetical protein [Pseudonocardiaceae bacterium]